MSDAMKIITAILLMLSGFMAYNLYFGSKGVETYKGIAQQLEREEHKALELQKRNQEVTDQVTEFRRQGFTASSPRMRKSSTCRCRTIAKRSTCLRLEIGLTLMGPTLRLRQSLARPPLTRLFPNKGHGPQKLVLERVWGRASRSTGVSCGQKVDFNPFRAVRSATIPVRILIFGLLSMAMI